MLFVLIFGAAAGAILGLRPFRVFVLVPVILIACKIACNIDPLWSAPLTVDRLQVGN